jgi:F-type H+-transporting ATPase subunit b
MAASALTLLGALALPFASEAGGQEAPQLFLGIPLAFWQAVNLVAFLGLLVWFLRKPAATFFKDRRREIEEGIRKTEESRQRAEQLAAEMESRLARLDQELAAIHEHAKKEAAAEQAELLRQAEADSAKIVERARGDLETRVRYARKELTTFAGDLAVEIARDVLAKNVTPQDEERLLREGLSALAAGTPKAPRAS